MLLLGFEGRKAVTLIFGVLWTAVVNGVPLVSRGQDASVAVLDPQNWVNPDNVIQKIKESNIVKCKC